MRSNLKDLKYKPHGVIFSLLFFLPLVTELSFTLNRGSINKEILSYTVDPKTQDIQFYWKNDSGEILRSIQNLKTYVEAQNHNLLFAMNGGMYQVSRSPVGLFIQNQTIITKIDSSDGNGNFYLKPNGIFYITTDHEAVICKTEDLKETAQILFATQSGPMLLTDGKIHPAFKEGSANLYIRNGVGILPDKRVIFAISKEPVNFYDFATWFKEQGCKNALYLDGFVSRAYLPQQNWKQMDGNFGVMIGVTDAPVK